MLLLMLPFVLLSQTDSEKRMRIAEVQQNYELYFRGDATELSAGKAMEKAMSEIRKEVALYADTAKGANIVFDAIVPMISKVEMPRGDRFRAFVFVKREDVAAMASSLPAPSPKADFAALPSAPPTKQSVKEEKTYTADPPGDMPGRTGNAIEEIKKVKTLSKLRPLLVSLKGDGEVLDYNRYSSLTDGTMYHVVVFSREGDIVAVLSPGRDERVNLLTGAEERLSKYEGYGAIAVLLPKKQ